MTKATKQVDNNGRVKYVVEDTQVIWANFAGAEGRYNPAGRRNFNIILDEESAKFLTDEGFNVKLKQAKDPDDDDIWTLKINVNFKSYYPPTIWKKNNHGTKQLDEEHVSELDTAWIEHVDLIFNPNVYDDRKTAYLDTLYATIKENELENRFFDEEDSATNTMTFQRVKSLED